MARSDYSIPATLDRSIADQEVDITPPGAPQIRPITIMVLGFWLLGLLVGFWFIMSTFMASAGVGTRSFWYLSWIFLIGWFGGVSVNKEMRLMMFPDFINYVPKSHRYVLTRKNSPAKSFYGIVGIDRIDKNGLIYYMDGTIGRSYLVVGTASLLLFPEHRDAVLDQYDSFWRKFKTLPGTEVITVTKKEPQRIYEQVANLEHLAQNLDNDDPDLRALLDERFDVLRTWVGDKYLSIHQYMIIKARSIEDLRVAQAFMGKEVEEGKVFRSVEPLSPSEVTDMLAVFYQGRRPGDVVGSLPKDVVSV